jgi:hypothetical protein
MKQNATIAIYRTTTFVCGVEYLCQGNGNGGRTSMAIGDPPKLPFFEAFDKLLAGGLTMKLLPGDLRKIASVIESLSEIEADVKTFVVNGHDVNIRKQVDQREGKTWYIVDSIVSKRP